MKICRRKWLAAGVLLAVGTSVTAQEFPKLIRIVVPFAPGASNDTIARAIAPLLARRLDTTVIVENRPGAGSIIGSDAVAKAPKDGSMLLLSSQTFLTSAATAPKLPYDAINSFAPVAMIGQNPSLVTVSASSPYKTLPEFLAAARATPDALTYASAGFGSSGHMATERLLAESGIRMRHVPYKGAALAAVDLASGHVDLMVSSYGTLAPYIRSGKLRVLASTGNRPHPSFPNVPLVSATVSGFLHEVWVGVLAPAGTPAALIDRLNREINAISASAELKAVFEPDGIEAAAMSPSAFAAHLRTDLAQWKQIAASRRIVTE